MPDLDAYAYDIQAITRKEYDDVLHGPLHGHSR
jgi:hypothetical protein